MAHSKGERTFERGDEDAHGDRDAKVDDDERAHHEQRSADRLDDGDGMRGRVEHAEPGVRVVGTVYGEEDVDKLRPAHAGVRVQHAQKCVRLRGLPERASAFNSEIAR